MTFAVNSDYIFSSSALVKLSMWVEIRRFASTATHTAISVTRADSGDFEFISLRWGVESLNLGPTFGTVHFYADGASIGFYHGPPLNSAEGVVETNALENGFDGLTIDELHLLLYNLNGETQFCADDLNIVSRNAEPTVTVQSDHNYLPNTNEQWIVDIPGATCYTLTMDPRSWTPQLTDFVKIFGTVTGIDNEGNIETQYPPRSSRLYKHRLAGFGTMDINADFLRIVFRI